MNNYIFNRSNENCYHFKTLDLNEGLYDSFVDMTYIFDGKFRKEKHVYEQINKFRPTKKLKFNTIKDIKNVGKNFVNKK